jgi:hypothetical protein
VGASSQTVTYNTIAALALDKLSDKIADAISTANAAFYFYKKRGNWEGVSSGGNQLRKSVLYQLQTVRPIGSFGTVNVNPTEGHTSVYFDWVQAAIAVSFSDLEEFKTSGSESIQSIVKAKFQQAKASLDDMFNRSLIRGQGDIDSSSFTTALTSSTDGSTFIDPLPKLVSGSPSSSLTVGGVNQSTNSWWQNQYVDSVSTTTLSQFLADLRTLHVYTQRGGGGADKAPDFHICDERLYNVYEKALALTHRNPDYQKADIPFANILFKGQPVMFDELLPDIKSGSTTMTYGTWYMLNSAWMGFMYDNSKSFKLGPTVRPNNQLVSTALMPVRGTHWVNNRRKLGVLIGATLATLEAATS